jgi:glucose-1-phosphate cytidylyltransferase
MKVVILCGGKGIRIRDLSEDLPKPMIPIGKYPIVQHIMSIYSRYGHNDFILCLGYKSWKFKEYFLNYRAATSDITIDLADSGSLELHDIEQTPSWKITLAETGLNAMTGCRIKRIQKYVGDETFMLTYGDGVSDIDIGKLVEFHKSHGKAVTVTSVRPASRFGELVVDGGQVTEFQEKPQTSAGLINGGFFVCEPEVFDYALDDESCSWEEEPLRRLAREGKMMTYVHEGFWMPMDTTREHILLNQMWKRDEAPWKR